MLIQISFSFSSLVMFFQFHLLILYAVHSEKAKVFGFFFAFFLCLSLWTAQCSPR